MLFTETPLSGAFIIDTEPVADERGFFARSWCRREFEEHVLNSSVAQCNISFNARRGTLRGLHFQAPPHEEAKLVRATRGAIFDVIVDLRSHSPTRYHWYGIELTQENRRSIYVPEGFGHGFQTLEDNTEVYYQMSEFYHPESARGIRWDDPLIHVRWPIDNPIMSERDQGYLLLAG